MSYFSEGENKPQEEKGSQSPDKTGLIMRYFSILLMSKFAPEILARRNTFIERKAIEGSTGLLLPEEFSIDILPEDAQTLGIKERVVCTLDTGVIHLEDDNVRNIEDRYCFTVENAPDNWRIDEEKQIAWHQREMQIVHYHYDPMASDDHEEAAYIYFPASNDDYDTIPLVSVNQRDKETLPRELLDVDAFTHQDSPKAREWIISVLHAIARATDMEEELAQIEKIILKNIGAEEEE